jgi:hypothetical protein
MCLVGMSILSIILNLGLGYHTILLAKISQSPLRKLTSSSINPKLGASHLVHIWVSSVIICHAI